MTPLEKDFFSVSRVAYFFNQREPFVTTPGAAAPGTVFFFPMASIFFLLLFMEGHFRI